MRKKRNIGLFLAIGSIVVVLGSLGWFLTTVFESEVPSITVNPLPEFLSKKQEFTLTVLDLKRGLKQLKVTVRQGGREITVLEKKFPFEGLFNAAGIHQFDIVFSVDPFALNLAQGRVDLIVSAWDYSRRKGGDGNLSLFEHKMVVDTIPPAIRTISRLHYVNVGGSGLVVYQTSSDAVKSGLYVDEIFFPGYPLATDSKGGNRACYFGIPLHSKGKPDIYLWAEDRAGNRAKTGFYCQVRKKRFPTDKMNITESFLKKILPGFAPYLGNLNADEVTKFLKINRELREENAGTFFDLRTNTSPEKLWDGVWIRLKNAATMAKFGERRFYYYKGQEIDEQTHMGVDLASLAHSGVQAANNGRVILAETLGIYGLALVLDHGQGLASIYAHLSGINVKPGQEVSKGEIIGTTGQTGLAGGDHLHFGIMVGGVPVNPVEWWDSHWIKDNIMKKLELAENP
ncbi:MAG TPA: M23 family metallopeptidase [Deltaproteobacteria bacterium]|nr:M23 family metallopeptidase [Deltaproteobacteria bacterium]HIJ41807.1 M23 family metallopeptidase [Deltaproteobacteria bacterium]